jgi:hypothetical protein
MWLSVHGKESLPSPLIRRRGLNGWQRFRRFALSAQQGAFRRVGPPRTGSTPAVGRPGAGFMGMTSGTILGSLTA